MFKEGIRGVSREYGFLGRLRWFEGLLEAFQVITNRFRGF